MTEPNYQTALAPLVEAFQILGVAYHIGGSIASASHGVARATLDIDLIADLRLQHIRPLVDRLQSGYYVDQEMIQEAVLARSSFNVIHLETMVKLDVFILKDTSYDEQAFLRADLRPISDDPDSPLFFVESAEDVILNKLRWYRLGGCVSERQWSDVLGVMRVQAGALDMRYLRRWAAGLGVADLLEQAILQAGVEPV
jgi:hypothetical protein